MQRLNEMSWDKLTIGDIVVSPQGRFGRITELEAYMDEDENILSGMSEITMKWDDVPALSKAAHGLLKKVFWFGENEADAHKLMDALAQ